MWLKKSFRLLVCMAVVCCLGVTAWAADSAVLLETLESSVPGRIEPADSTGGVSARASASLGTTVPANGVRAVREGLTLDAGETVAFDCTYSPSSASMDFGLIAPDGRFYYINVTNGSIDQAIRVSERGTYTLAIMNNSSSAVTVTGTVQY